MNQAPASAKNRDWTWGALLLLATSLAYLPAWNGLPLWDDAAHMTKPALRSAAGLASIWTRLGATQQYYPLMHSTFWLEYQLWGASTLGYHLVSILLHFASALLVVKILRRLDIPGAWLAGGIFALHPVMVESVAWISELKNTLSGVFFLAAALAYLKFDNKRATKFYAVALVLFVLGLLCKSVIVTLPPALLVVLWWMRGRLSWKRDGVPLLPFFIIGLVSGLFTAWVERTFIGAAGSAFHVGLTERCLIAGRAVWFYLFKLLWPANLIFIYPRWHVDASVAWQYLFPAAFLVAALLFWRLRKRSRAPMAVLLYFPITLFPALGFFNVYPFRYSFVADHFQYLACLGPIAAAAAGIVKVAGYMKDRLRRPLQPILSGVVLSALFILSWSQSRMYSDAETLYRTTIARNSDCWMAHTHLGLLLMNKGRHDEAMAHLLRALALTPDQADAHADAHANLGLLLMDTGRYDEAKAHLLKALELDPNHADAHNNLGIVLVRQGQTEEAIGHYQKALELHPDHAEIHYNLGDLLAKMGQPDQAMAHYQKALALLPDYADAHNNLGRLLAQMDRPGEAIAHFRKALEHDPNQANAQNNLGVMLARIGQTDEAIVHYRKALEIDPVESDHLDNLVSALLKKGQLDEAISTLQHALAMARSSGDEARASAIVRNLARLQDAIHSAQTASPLPP